ncbi:MAG: hypothetical protein CML13_06935 [Puniceicoccaceae bacterium]|nr:hypothetical protein [Puniceicoccaceae bacterium]|tara:strand:+ start:15807 stop:18227 length:2421 start_codon:yes stop_codon:yes gene_type:complete
MSIEHAIIQRSRPWVQATNVEAILTEELSKGCSREISATPVCLVPPYRNLQKAETELQQPIISGNTLVIYRIWLSPEQIFSWTRNERFLKELSRVHSPILFEIYGNSTIMQMQFRCASEDAHTLRTAFSGELLQCQLTEEETCPFSTSLSHASSLSFRDYLPAAPAYHLNLTIHEEFEFTPLESFLCAIAGLPESATGFYQCLFQPVPPNSGWHRNIETLYDLEYLHRAFSESRSLHFSAQLPSSELRLATQRMERKAHPDKPIFATALRIGLLEEEDVSDKQLESLTTFLGLFQQGSKRLQYVDSTDYAPVVPQDRQRELLSNGQVHRNGFLLNSNELSGLVHLFPPEIVTDRSLPLELASDFSNDIQDIQGTVIGSTRIAGRDHPVAIDPLLRERSVHILGGSGSGKTTVMQHMVLQDIEEGCGLVYIDPHGDAVRELLSYIPDKHLDRVIWFDPNSPNLIPAWNPLALHSQTNLHRLADDTLASIERVSRDWGDRLGMILRNGLLGLLQSKPEPVTLMDLYHLIRADSPQGKTLREMIVSGCEDETVRNFWKHDFLKDYKRGDLAAPKHKLDKLLGGGGIQLMFSQPESRINIREIMDGGKILLVDLSTVGEETRRILGSFLLTQHMITAFGRSTIPYAERRPFGIYIDECHLFTSIDAIENLITQARKFRIRLTIANQFLRQFGRVSQIDALSTVGSTILGRLDKNDASYFAKDFQGKVKPEDIVSLEPYRMFARLDTSICKIATHPLPEPVRRDITSIIESSYKQYYRPASEIRARASKQEAYSPRLPEGLTDDDFYYDEF